MVVSILNMSTVSLFLLLLRGVTSTPLRSSTNWKPLVTNVLQNESKLHASWFLLNHSIKLETITILFCVFSPNEAASTEQRKISWFTVTNCWKQEDSRSFPYFYQDSLCGRHFPGTQWWARQSSCLHGTHSLMEETSKYIDNKVYYL